jgi:hypothetical protein
MCNRSTKTNNPITTHTQQVEGQPACYQQSTSINRKHRKGYIMSVFAKPIINTPTILDFNSSFQ